MPAVSVIIVSDYASGGHEGLKDVRQLLTTLAQQDFPEAIEFLLCESERYRDDVPPDLASILPTLQVRFFPEHESYGVKNQGVRAARAEFVAVLDADCMPDRTWVRRLVNALRTHPDAAVVSGRTLYPGGSLAARMCALLGRSHVDPGRFGRTRFIAPNNCAFRRAAYLAHPLPEGLGPFASRIQSEAFRRAGWLLLFDPEMLVVHDFEGWSMEADIRRNNGYGTIRTRLDDPRMPYAWLARLGRGAIAPIVAGKVLTSWSDCIRCGAHYGLRFVELPIAMAASVGLHALEIPGMLCAYRGNKLDGSHFR